MRTLEPLMLVAGVDSSTQSTKVLLCQADDGAVVAQATAPHPDGTECDPELWWRALGQAGEGRPRRAQAPGGGAPTHGTGGGRQARRGGRRPPPAGPAAPRGPG